MLVVLGALLPFAGVPAFAAPRPARVLFPLLERAPGEYVALAGDLALVLGRGGFDAWMHDGRDDGECSRLRFVFPSSVPPRPDVDAAPAELVRIGTSIDALRGFARVRYRDVEPGIDVVVRADGEGIAYDVEAAPGVDAARFTFRVEGAIASRIRDDGALELDTPTGRLVHRAPCTFTKSDPPRALRSRFVDHGGGRIGFEVQDAPHDLGIRIDPGLEFATRYGGSDFDDIAALAVAPSGGVVVAGSTWSTNLPLAGTPFDATSSFPLQDAFVAALGPDGKTLTWATFLGGSGSDAAMAVALDGLGRVWIGGRTDSTDFPTSAGAFDASYGGNGDGFVARIDGAGSPLGVGTYLGGGQNDEVRGVAIAANGSVLLAGVTASVDFPVTPGAFDTQFQGGPAAPDAFCCGLNATASALTFSTYLGGTSVDEARAVAALGNDAIVVGRTDSADWPTLAAFDATFGGGLNDGFLARVTAANGQLAFSTFVGGTDPDVLDSVATFSSDTIVVCGRTRSSDMPAVAGYDVFFNGSDDAYVAQWTGAGALTAASFLGTNGDERALAVRIDSIGQALIVGRADGAGFPATSLAFDATYNGNGDAFVTKFKPALTTLAESTYFGGSGFDEAHACGLSPTNALVFAGRSTSADLPTTSGAFQTAPLGSSDGFVGLVRAKLCPLGPALQMYGAGKAGSAGVPQLSSLNQPVVPSADFMVTIGFGVPGALPLLFVGLQPLALPFDGGQILVNPLFNVGLPPLDASGRLFLPVPIAENAGLCGVTFRMQAIWFDPGAAGFNHTAQTNGLAITFGS